MRETGESKPDVGNLIALCGTLDLNIEYLCFGTTPAAEQTPPKKAFPLWAKVLVSAAVIACALFVGTLIGGTMASSNVNTDADVQMSAINIADIQVADASATYNASTGYYEITVTPSLVYDDIELLLHAEPNNSSSTLSFLCTREGSVYKGYFKNANPHLQYTITAVFVHGDVKKQIPIMNFHADESGNCGYERLWE